MLSLRDFWRRHRRKILVTAGVIGSSYLLYKLYDVHKQGRYALERELKRVQENDELIKAQMQAHFEDIQKIADTMTLPQAMRYLGEQIAEVLDLTQLTDRLIKGKGQPSTLTSTEKLELWDKLKILSFTRLLSSVWAITVLCLYIRVQVNILGRHLYIDAARGLGSHSLTGATDSVDGRDLEKFLASAEFLANSGLPALISDMEAATTEIFRGKQLRDIFNAAALRETIMQVVDMFMGTCHWVDYLMPEGSRHHGVASSNDGAFPSDFTRFDQLMVETHAVLSSAEFKEVIEQSLNRVIVALVEDMEAQCGGNLHPGLPLAKLLPRVAQQGPLLFEEPSREWFVQIMKTVPEVETFFTLLYSSMPTS